MRQRALAFESENVLDHAYVRSLLGHRLSGQKPQGYAPGVVHTQHLHRPLNAGADKALQIKSGGHTIAMQPNRLLVSLLIVFLGLVGCGGGGGGGGSPSGPAYATVQPPAGPAPEVVDTRRAQGIVSTRSDTLDGSGRSAGVVVSLRGIAPDGSLGPVQASATTGPDGRFSIDMPSGRTTDEGVWLLAGQVGQATLRAYLHPAAVRIDTSSEALVRQMTQASGRLPSFPRNAASTLRALANSLALYADATGDKRSSMTLDAASDHIVQSLSRDQAMTYVISTLRTGGALPAGGVGDIGSFYAISDPYNGYFTDGTGQRLRATIGGQFGAKMAADGSWRYQAGLASLTNGQWTPVPGSGGPGRLTPNGGYQTLGGSGTDANFISGLVGEYVSQSFPLRPGARQLDARRITATNLNFTGGNDEQPLAFSSVETVGGVETLTLAAGQFRAVRVTTDVYIVVPASANAVSTRRQSSAMWLVPGVGIVKETSDVFVNGVAEAPDPASTLELTSAYASAVVWPSQVRLTPSLVPDFVGGTSCRPVQFPSLRRFVTVRSSPPVVNSTSRLAVALWDMDTGRQIGATRVFAGNLRRCPVAAGSTTSMFVLEAFSERNLMNIWPSDAATAMALSDVVHQISAVDLGDLATYQLSAVPDATQPRTYWPAEIGSIFPAPDSTGRFVVGTVRSDSLDFIGRTPQYVQVLGPGVASPVASAGRTLLIGADWDNGRVFSIEYGGSSSLRLLPFTPTSGIDAPAARQLRTGLYIPTLWYASANLLHLNDGSTVRILDGGDGQRLPHTAEECGFGAGVLVCLDSANDRLVRFNPDTLAIEATAELGSELRGLSLAGPDFRVRISNVGGIKVIDTSTFVIYGQVVHVGRWR